METGTYTHDPYAHIHTCDQSSRVDFRLEIGVN